jgi:hypothetical protein
VFHRTGITVADQGPDGVITASNYGSVVAWPNGLLYKAAQDVGLAVDEAGNAAHRAIIQYDSIAATQAAQVAGLSTAATVRGGLFTGAPASPDASIRSQKHVCINTITSVASATHVLFDKKISKTCAL